MRSIAHRRAKRKARDFAFVHPIDDLSQIQIGFGASGSIYNDMQTFNEHLLVGSLGYARSLGRRWFVDFSPYLYDYAVGHDRTLQAWGNNARATYVVSPRWSLLAAHAYERDRYPNTNTSNGPVIDYAGMAVFRPAAGKRQNEFRFETHLGTIGPHDGINRYSYRRFKLAAEYDLGRRWHLDAGLSVEEREFRNRFVGAAAMQGRREDDYMSGEIGCTYLFRESWRLRGYFASIKNVADARQTPSDHYRSNEFGLALRWSGWRAW